MQELTIFLCNCLKAHVLSINIFPFLRALAHCLPVLEDKDQRLYHKNMKIIFPNYLAGCLEEAHTFAVQALELTRVHQERGHQAYTLRLLGEIAAQCSPPERELAEVHYQQALALAEELGMRPLQAHCHRGLGTLYAATGQREQARTALSTALTLYRDMDMTFWLPQTEAALAQVET